ncbi:MAG: outer membrane lipoprotein chaperone LolA, partial [Proteobacteria bacterium]
LMIMGYASSASAAIPALLEKVEKKYLEKKSLEAKFSQTQYQKLTKMEKNLSGVISLKYPNKFRWETLKPDQNLFVSDGKKFWSYTPPFMKGEQGQVIEKKTSEVQSQLASLLLSAAFSKIKDAKIVAISDSVFKVTPKKGTAGTVSQVEVEIDPKTAQITRVKLEHDGGNRSEVKLSDIKLGEPMSDEMFRFVIPPGTEVIRE